MGIVRIIFQKRCTKKRREEECIRILVGKPEGKRPSGRPRRRLEDILRWILDR
jgi:hypothetical protein